MYYSGLEFFDIANGTGFRTTLFVSGCRNHCKGCFQPQTWNFDNGLPYTKETEEKIIESLTASTIEGLTVLGGEPFEEENQEVIVNLLERVKRELPDKNIWVFTGYLYDKDLIKGGRKYTQYTDRMLKCIDVLVDGPFIEEKKNLSLKFRGSENQRIINLSGKEEICH